jgi:phosphoribosylamine--glycine ligase
MGAYSPAPVVTPEVHARVMREVIQPHVKGMEKEGTPYTGFLYAGLMIDARRAIPRVSNSTAAWATRKRSPS